MLRTAWRPRGFAANINVHRGDTNSPSTRLVPHSLGAFLLTAQRGLALWIRPHATRFLKTELERARGAAQPSLPHHVSSPHISRCPHCLSRACPWPRAPFMACKTRLPSSPPHPPFLHYLVRIFKSSHSQLKLLLYSRAASLKSTTEQPGKGRETSSVQYSSESSTLMLQLLNTTFLCRARH